MMNTGHSIIFNVDNDTRHHINITGGPLSYKYQFQEIHIHYGLHDQFGSEHSINGYTFPAEVTVKNHLIKRSKNGFDHFVKIHAMPYVGVISDI